uniref:V-type proton ATPase subunit G n=1 Tax=Phasianus colchicus TaxID=9054 RepID=A0A669QCT2_PHACC
MASQSQGIQQLLQAEKRAAEKVAEARKRKNRRLKQAKEEAQAEIEQYRLQREKEFKAKEAAVSSQHHTVTVLPPRPESCPQCGTCCQRSTSFLLIHSHMLERSVEMNQSMVCCIPRPGDINWQ